MWPLNETLQAMWSHAILGMSSGPTQLDPGNSSPVAKLVDGVSFSLVTEARLVSSYALRREITWGLWGSVKAIQLPMFVARSAN